PLVELDPGVHAPELDVADHVVERLQADPGRRLAVLDRRAVAGQERPRVVLSVHERVDDVAIGRDRGQLDAAVFVLGPVRLGDALRAALDRLAVGLTRARDQQRDVLRRIPVPAGELGDLAVYPQATRQDE